MSRAIKTIAHTAIVVKNDEGFVARAVELPVTMASRPAKTQRGAIKNLKAAISLYLAVRADEGTLAAILDDAGFVGAVGSSKAEAHTYSSQAISLPLPPNAFGSRLRKKDAGDAVVEKGQEAHAT